MNNSPKLSTKFQSDTLHPNFQPVKCEAKEKIGILLKVLRPVHFTPHLVSKHFYSSVKTVLRCVGTEVALGEQFHAALSLSGL